LLGGVVAARASYRSNHVVAAALVMGALLMVAAASGLGGGLGAMVALAATGFAVGVGGPSRDLMIKQATPKGATGRVYGTVYSGLDAGFAVSPALFGLMMDQGWYQATLAGAALTLLLAVVAALAVGQHTATSGS
jgi:FSR family fosmidomycin resistance protein-like MFS transporter